MTIDSPPVPSPPSADPEAEAAVEDRTLQLRILEAGITRDHLRLLRKSWSWRATASGLVTALAFVVALWPYLAGGAHFRFPPAIAYASAFLFLLAAAIALLSAARALRAASLVSRASLKIRRAEAVQEIFGIPLKGRA